MIVEPCSEERIPRDWVGAEFLTYNGIEQYTVESSFRGVTISTALGVAQERRLPKYLDRCRFVSLFAMDSIRRIDSIVERGMFSSVSMTLGLYTEAASRI